MREVQSDRGKHSAPNLEVGQEASPELRSLIDRAGLLHPENNYCQGGNCPLLGLPHAADCRHLTPRSITEPGGHGCVLSLSLARLPRMASEI